MDSDSALGMLTWEEWNAAYFLGLEAVFRHGCQCNVSEQVAKGVSILEAAGYRLGCDPSDGDRVHGRAAPGLSVHHRSCREIMAGSFDTVGRGRNTMLWLNANMPQVSTQWLGGLLDIYDRLHPGVTGGRDP
jgi:hypothetical protein